MKYQSSRRSFLVGSLASGAIAGSMAVGLSPLHAATSVELAEARRLAARRRRRVVYNNDGDDIWTKGVNSVETFLADRHEPLLGTQVDSIHYSTTQSFNYFTHGTNVAERFFVREGQFANNNLESFLAQKTDGLRLSAEFAHNHGMESIWSLRMNDIHDVAEPLFAPKWKQEDPRRVMSTRDLGLTFNDRRRLWSLVDFEHPDVEPQLAAIVEEVLQNYPVDGVELDWMRAPFYFRTAYAGEPATTQQIDLLTRLTQTIRNVVLRESERQGKPFLLWTRVPVTVENCRRIGIDVAAWLEAGLIDVLGVSGGYVPFGQPVEGMIELGHKHNVNVYPCISKSGMAHRPPRSVKETELPAEAWFAAAQRCFAQGADGVYSFNLFAHAKSPMSDYVRSILSRIGDPETLKSADKAYVISDAGLFMPSAFWAKDVEDFSRGLPVDLKPNASTTLPSLTVYDGADALRNAKSVELRLDLADVNDDAPPQVLLNGVLLKASQPAQSVAQVRRHTFLVPKESVKSGDNQLAVTATQQGARAAGVELWVHYAS